MTVNIDRLVRDGRNIRARSRDRHLDLNSLHMYLHLAEFRCGSGVHMHDGNAFDLKWQAQARNR